MVLAWYCELINQINQVEPIGTPFWCSCLLFLLQILKSSQTFFIVISIALLTSFCNTQNRSFQPHMCSFAFQFWWLPLILVSGSRESIICLTFHIATHNQQSRVWGGEWGSRHQVRVCLILENIHFRVHQNSLICSIHCIRNNCGNNSYSKSYYFLNVHWAKCFFVCDICLLIYSNSVNQKLLFPLYIREN